MSHRLKLSGLVFAALCGASMAQNATTKSAYPTNGTSTTGPANWTTTQLLQAAAVYVNFEAAFFEIGVNFTQEQYDQANETGVIKGRVSQMLDHVKAQQTFLTNSLGTNEPCTYALPTYTSPYNWLETACGITQVASSMFVSIVEAAADPAVRRAIGAMVSTAGRHNAFIYGQAFAPGPPWTGPFDTVISIEQALSLVSVFTKSCPPSTPALPFEILPAINGGRGLDGYAFSGNISMPVTWQGANESTGPFYFNYRNGLGSGTVPVSSNGTVIFPDDVLGWTFATITNSTNDTLAGSTFIHLDFFSNATNSGFDNPASIEDVLTAVPDP